VQPDRRAFLRLGLGASTLLACEPTVPSFLARSALALAAGPPAARAGRALVVVELNGGNDGLNTVVPYKDEVYRKSRPTLRVPPGRVRKIDARMGLHPSLGGLAALLEKGQLAIVQSVGYPNPNRSHFQSMDIWHTARTSPKNNTPGWLARFLDRGKVPLGDAPALHVQAGQLPRALAFGLRQPTSLSDPRDLRRHLGVPESAGAREQRAALDALAGQEVGEAGSLLQFVSRSTAITYAASARLEALSGRKGSAPDYPEGYGLARRLRLIGQLLEAGVGTRVFYTRLGGFDTHGTQLATHPGLLQELGASLQAFLAHLDRAGLGGRVLVLVFSEFGRRLAENGSGGTDHGTAGPVFLLGRGVRSGLHGPCPDLEHLEGGDPRHAIDFRRVYATLLDRWLECPSRAILGAPFEHLAVLKGRPGRAS
jgi:uncharacterized protein (DUF1501 family)